MTDPDRIAAFLRDRDRKAGFSPNAVAMAFVAIFATAAAAGGLAEPFAIALAPFLLGFPVTLGLGVFSLARGPILSVLALLFAAGAFCLGVSTVWNVFGATHSTAAIALFLIPVAEMMALVIVLAVGLLGDALIGRKAR